MKIVNEPAVVLIQDNIPEERRYWVYSISVEWWMDLTAMYPTSHKHYDGCKRNAAGLCRNSVTFSGRTYETEQTPEAIEKAASECWDRYGKKGDHDPESATAKWSLVQRSEWACEWFSHRTPDKGQSDAEALESFRDYVRWALPRSFEMRRDRKCSPEEPFICLMGAEDEWRWRGVKGDGDPNGEESPPPCRCEGCKKHGVIRVNH